MSNRKQEVIGITIDKKTKNLVDNYSQTHSLSRSAVIRFAVNEFFINLEGDYAK